MIRARRHPVFVTLLWAWQATCGIWVALPFAQVVSVLYNGHRGGDSALWESGGLGFLATIERLNAAQPAFTTHVVLVLLFGAAFGPFLLSGLLASFVLSPQPKRTTAERLRELTPHVLALLGRVAILYAVSAIAQCILFIAALSIGSYLRRQFSLSLGTVRADLIAGAFFAACVLLVVVVGILRDVAYAMAAHAKSARALELGTRIVRTKARSLLWGWFWRTSVANLLLLPAAFVSSAWGGRAGFALLGVCMAHQAVIFLRVALRASWLAHALRITDDLLTLPQDHETVARTVAQVFPNRGPAA